LELRRRREAEGVTERSQQPRVEHDREVADDGLEAFPTYDYLETQWDGVATERYQTHMDDIAKSLREDGVLVLNTAGWRRGIPFNRGSRRVSEELQTALGALNAENRFPNLPECVRLEGKKHVTWPRNVAKANVTVRDRGVDYGIARAMDALDTVARDTLHNVCRSLGFRSTELDALLDESPLPLEEKGASTLTVFAYDAARDALPSLTEFAAEPHVDRTILTLVVSNQRDGLRVRRADDSWRTASLGRYRIAVIPGHTLEHALGGAISATTHAVSRLRVPRNALVFRLAARRDAVVSPATPRDIAARYPTQTAKELDEAFERTHRSVNRPPEPANPARRAARATPAIGRKINVTVRDQDNYKLHIKTRLDCEFLRIFDAFRDDRGLAHDAVRFLFDGSRINPLLTPRDLDMEDGDCIEAMMEQVGD
jgi:small ubiquitin-related modifier